MANSDFRFRFQFCIFLTQLVFNLEISVDLTTRRRHTSGQIDDQFAHALSLLPQYGSTLTLHANRIKNTIATPTNVVRKEHVTHHHHHH